MKQQIKALAGERGRAYARRLGRLRLITKARNAWAAGSRPHQQPGVWLREVVLSPEVDTYTYALDNVDELAAALAAALRVPEGTARAALDEALTDPELGARIASDVSYRVLWLRRRPPLGGRHLAAWAVTRLTRPELVVETGILDGLGSRTVLRALQRNAEDGDEGRLVSFDVMPTAGVLVPDRLAGRWTRVIQATDTGLEEHLGSRRVDVFLHDSLPTAAYQRMEIGWAVEHDVQVVISAADWTGVIAELAEETGARSAQFQEHPHDHYFVGDRLGLLVRDRAAESAV